MSSFSKLIQEAEQLRGIADSDLRKLTNEQLIMLALYVMFGALGVEDENLEKELLWRVL